MEHPIQVDIREDWHLVKPVLTNMLLGYQDLPEDLYAACIYKDASYFRVEDGFIILQQRPLWNPKEKELFVWACCSFKTTNTLIRDNLPWLKEVAKQLGSKKITFWSRSRGLAALIGPDVKQVETHYEMEIT